MISLDTVSLGRLARHTNKSITLGSSRTLVPFCEMVFRYGRTVQDPTRKSLATTPPATQVGRLYRSAGMPSAKPPPNLGFSSGLVVENEVEKQSAPIGDSLTVILKDAFNETEKKQNRRKSSVFKAKKLSNTVSPFI